MYYMVPYAPERFIQALPKVRAGHSYYAAKGIQGEGT